MARKNNASVEQVSYYAGSVATLIFIYFNALKIYKRLKENKIKKQW